MSADAAGSEGRGAEAPEVEPEAPPADHADWLRRLVPPLRDLIRVSRRPEMHGAVSDAAGVALPEHTVLALTRIGDFQPIRLSDLADQMDTGRTTVSRQVAELVQRGLVRRDADEQDGRAVMLSLTKEGEDALERVWGAWMDILAVVTRDWAPEDRESFLEQVRLLGSGLGAVISER